MAKVKSNNSNDSTPLVRPGLTPEAEESQCIALAMNLVKKRLIEGTASSQEVTHFLKLGSTKSVLENEKLKEENKLLRARTNSIESAEDRSEQLVEVLNALKQYRGMDEEDEF